MFCLLKVFLYSGSSGLGVVGLFVSFVLIYLSQALIITWVARLLDRSGFIPYFIHSIMGYCVCSVSATPCG